MSQPQRIALLGATGSIGRSALDVIARHPARYRVTVMAAGSRLDALLELCRQHHPEHAVIADDAQYPALRDGLAALGLSTHAHGGMAAMAQLAGSEACDTVIAAIVGAAGLPSTLAAARVGKRLLLANKESLVLAGELLMAEVARSGSVLVPIDSEHNAIFQCLPDGRSDAGIARIILTASGGPFRGRQRDDLASVTPTQAIAHPKWSMGPKISVDSATLMNKGLEVIEAHHLFGLAPAHIDVLVHPQSLVHSFVEFVDGSTLAQLGLPDMRTTLAVGLAWPERVSSGVNGLDLIAEGGTLQFEAPDLDTFPCLGLAYDALRAGGTAPATLNALNEEAVSAFLQGRIAFLDIPALIGSGLSALPSAAAESLEALDDADREARQYARESIRRLDA
ncbi:MAG: 1-deoxy-D-xylulose-5-phosphate reductoisomerase [Pseudomonadota bacterium]|nr:1-deoxy-D-xylulose-5-phosphate reductoisomerase [Pseudomonadota bacterium]